MSENFKPDLKPGTYERQAVSNAKKAALAAENMGLPKAQVEAATATAIGMTVAIKESLDNTYLKFDR